MDIKFLSTVAVITPDSPASRRLYLDTLALPLDGDEYLHSEQVAGCKSFGIWPLSEAAEACLGTSQWPADRPTPQTSIEFDFANARLVTSATRELEQAVPAITVFSPGLITRIPQRGSAARSAHSRATRLRMARWRTTRARSRDLSRAWRDHNELPSSAR